jgi:hypothetical protein
MHLSTFHTQIFKKFLDYGIGNFTSLLRRGSNEVQTITGYYFKIYFNERSILK